MTNSGQLKFGDKNLWLLKLKRDLLQNKYDLKKEGLYSGAIKNQIEDLLRTLKEDYEI